MSTEAAAIISPAHVKASSGHAEHVEHAQPAAALVATQSSDTANTDIILPKWIYIKDQHGRYLTHRSGPVYHTLTFRTGAPDLDNAFEAVRSSGSWYKFVARNGRHVMRYYSGWYSSDHETSAPSYNIITSTGNKVYLKDNYGPSMFVSNELDSKGSPVAHDYINETSEMEIVQAAIKNEIINVKYDINGAKVREAAPLVVLSTSVRNDSDGNVNQTLSYTYEKWVVGTWNNTAGIEIGAKASFSAGVPFVASADFEISVTASYSHEWGGETGTKQIINTSTTVTVPPKKKARATVIVRNAQLDVGFTYTQRILWSNGKSEDSNKTGIYNNVDSWHVDVVLDNWQDV